MVSQELIEKVAEGALRALMLRLQGQLTDSTELLEQLQGAQKGSAIEEIEVLLEACTGVYSAAAREGWTVSQVEEAFKGDEAFGDHHGVPVEVWRMGEASVREKLRAASFTGDGLQKVSWRIDIRQHSRHVEEIADACAILELETAPKIGSNPSVVRFEADREGVAKLQSQVQRIQAVIAEAASG